jgi:hypothetical protein
VKTDISELKGKIDLIKLLSGKSTYPTWSTGRSYSLFVEKQKSNIIVSYQHSGNKRPSRSFPRYIKITPKLLWFFGFIYGEGSKSQGSSAYRRFTITNSDSKPMKLSLDVLEEIKVLSREDIPPRSIKIARSQFHNDKKILEFWKKELKVTPDKFYLSPKYDENKKTEHGVCHVFISDVLLRRVMDEIAQFIFNRIKEENSGEWI